MLTNLQIDFFEENGYLLIPGAYDKDETFKVRQRLMNYFNTDGKTTNELTDLYYNYPEFIPFTINEKILGIAKQLLQDETPVLTKETSSHKGFYPTWHKDTTTVEKYGHTFHQRPEFKMIRFGVYFQDNNEYGGGLSVFAGSHKTADNFLMPIQQKSLLRRAIDKISPQSDENNRRLNPFHHKLVEIPSKVGDLAIFHFKTNHRATLPKVCSEKDVPSQFAKISIFDTFGRNNETSIQYNEFLKTRPEEEYDLFRERKDFSPELIKASRELNFKLI